MGCRGCASVRLVAAAYGRLTGNIRSPDGIVRWCLRCAIGAVLAAAARLAACAGMRPRLIATATSGGCAAVEPACRQHVGSM